MKAIGVIGGGAWGTALAQVQAAGGHDCMIWAREAEVVDSINSKHENSVFLSGVPLSPALKATGSLSEIATACDILLIVTPAQYTRASLIDLKPYFKPDTVIVLCSKGIEIETGMILSDVVKEILPKQPVAVLTGPTFASEVARGLPCAVTIAAEKNLGVMLQERLGLKLFRPYLTEDMIGTQLGGALKNVIAIAAGIVAGRGMGESARAALITRGLAEISRLCAGKGGKKETLMGMCGFGDMVLTCSSMQSRNYSLGFALGEGKTLEEILGPRNSVTEGVHTAKAALKMGARNAVDMPITEAVYKCLHDGMPIEKAIDEMLTRPFKY
jgi:glycerol-3-phosphate dehydrogenase (NAD(P)+)